MNKNYNLLSIVIPVHNQAAHIETVIENYLKALQYLPLAQEYILVVNASRDDSFKICSALNQKYNNVHTLNSDIGGWGHAVRLGLSVAKGDLICYTNSARTSPQDLSLLVHYAISNPGVVIKANRKVRSHFKRRLGSLLYNLQCRALFDLNYWDINGTPKVFPSEFSKLLQLKRTDDLIDLEFNAICKKEEYPLLEVPIYSTKRYSGTSTTNYNSALKMYVGAYKMWREWKSENQS